MQKNSQDYDPIGSFKNLNLEANIAKQNWRKISSVNKRLSRFQFISQPYKLVLKILKLKYIQKVSFAPYTGCTFSKQCGHPLVK